MVCAPALWCFWCLNVEGLGAKPFPLACALVKGRRPTQKTAHPNKKSLHEQFAQTLSACFVLILKGKGGTVCTNCPEIVCANCAFIWVGGFFGVGLPCMNLRCDTLHARGISAVLVRYRVKVRENQTCTDLGPPSHVTFCPLPSGPEETD